jgi:hypothetical protein
MNCDKCGKPVRASEDATTLQWLAHHDLSAMFGRPRHIRCSPSRAQYIMDASFSPPMVDGRPEYDKRLLPDGERMAHEAAWTQAWIRLQQECEKGRL